VSKLREMCPVAWQETLKSRKPRTVLRRTQPPTVGGTE